MLGRLSAAVIRPYAVICPPQARPAVTRACAHVWPPSGSLRAIQHMVLTFLESTCHKLSNAVGITRFGGGQHWAPCAGLSPAQEDVVAYDYFT